MSNSVNYIIRAIDKFSPVARKISTSVTKASASISKFNTKVSKMTGLGKSLSLKMGVPLLALTALSIRAYDKQAQALSNVNSVLKSTSGSVGISMKELRDEANKFQKTTLFGDEQILGDVTAQLLTFTGLIGDNFKRAQKAVLNLATTGKKSLKGAALQIGKALNDPVANLGALSIAGIQFSKKQKALIKHFAETNNLAKAQKLILKELEVQFGDSAQAAAKVGAGTMVQLMNSIGDLSEEIGKAQTEFLAPIIEWVKDLTAWFAKLSPGVKKTIALIILFGTVIGPVIFIIGKLALLAFVLFKGLVLLKVAVIALGSSFAFLLSPIYLIVIAIAALVAGIIYAYKNFKPFRDVVLGVFKAVRGAASWTFDFISKRIDVVVNAFKRVKNFFSSISEFFTGGDKNVNVNVRKSAESINNMSANGINENRGVQMRGAKMGSNDSRSEVTVNLNDPGKAVKSVNSRNSGLTKFNLGHNLRTMGA